MVGLDLSSSSQYGGNVGGWGSGSGSNSRIGGNPWRAGVAGGGGGGGDVVVPSLTEGVGGGTKLLSTLFSELSMTTSPPSPHLSDATATIAVNDDHDEDGRGGNVNVLPTSMQFPSIQYEPDLEPIHIIRTVHPDEHPLQVRDEMMKSLGRLRQRAEEQMGIGLYQYTNASSPGRGVDDGSRRQQQHLQQPQISFRWYFQPCSPLGGIHCSASPSPKIQSIPAYIELEGYCTDDDDDESDNNMNRKGVDDEYDNVVGGDDDDHNDVAGSYTDAMPSTLIRQLNKEKRCIAILQELSDSPFIVSGYLLKQSQNDPNVWKRMYCVLSDDRLWVIGRVKPLSEFSSTHVDTTPSHDVLSSLRVGRHSYINLLRSILIEREEPLNHRLPNTFRIVTSLGKTHSFRAFNSQSFRSWTAALSEKIAQTHTGGMLDLAHVITEEETLARCRRMEDIAVTPFLSKMPSSTEIPPLSMDIVRFGLSVAEYRELCRKVDEAMQLYKNSGGVVNMQTRVGGSPNGKAQKASLSSLSASQRARNEEMVTSVWEDARVVASKSAQLLHSIATSQHSILEAATEEDVNEEDEKTQSSCEVQVHNHSMKDLIDEQKGIQTLLSKRWKHQVTPEAESDYREMDQLPPLKLFDDLLKQFHSFSSPMEF
jgi:hypothetical protein